MRGLSLIIVLVALVQWSCGYSAYNRRAADCGSYGACPYTPGSSAQYTSSYSQSSSSSSASSSSSSYGYGSCCSLNSWAYAHIDDIRQFANRLRQEYNSMSSGSTSGYSTSYTPWSESIISLTGKTSGELDAICRFQSEQLVNDMRNGLVSYTVIGQPNFFEWKSSDILQKYAVAGVDYGQQQSLNLDLSNFDDVKTYNYPAEVKVVDGKTIVVHRNVTEAHKSGGEGTFENPYITVVKRNRTVVTTNTVPVYTGSYNTGSSYGSSNAGYTTGGQVYVPGGSTVVTRKKTVYDWVNQNMEPSVVGYSPVVNVDSHWGTSSNLYKPPVHIPVDTSAKSEVETFGTGSHVYQPSYSPGSTVTVRRYNKTIITNADGTVVSGSESHKKWVDGKLVYDTERPFGEWTVPRDEEWKREERERFFWFLTSGNITPQSLEAWQRQQEERLLALAERYHCTVEEIQDWHRKELERYRVLLGQYRAQTNDDTTWKRMERGRLDWLIHQNSVTRDELERWQKENADKLAQLARQYRITVDELKTWQIEELDRLYVFFNDQNNSMISRPNTESLTRTSEQERLEELIRQHNATIDQLQNSIKMDQQKLSDLSLKYRGNVGDLEKWLKGELSRLGGIITEQRNEMTRITEWQKSERDRLENIVKNHRGSVGNIDEQMAKDRIYLQTLANKYHVSIEEVEKWQRQELERLQKEGQLQIEMGIKEWQMREHENLKKLIAQNDLTVEEFQTQIVNDRQKLQNLASTYNVQVNEIQEWLRKEIHELKNEGFLNEVKKELAEWQQQERQRLLLIVQQSQATVQDLELKIKTDQSHLNQLAANYNVQVSEIEEWLKKELMRLQSQGLVKAEDLKDWQKAEREQMLILLQNNQLTIEEFERKLLSDRQKLADLAKMYNVKTTEIETWIKKEGERLQTMGLLQLQEQLNNWQKIERERIMNLVQQNNLSIKELEEKIKNDQTHLYSTAHQHQVRVEEIEEWIKKEIQRLQAEGLVELEKLKDWQNEWRGNLTNMVKERDFTVEEFHKWLLEDRSRLQALAMQHNVKIEEIETWVKNEEQRFVAMGLLKPNEKLTNWQEVERRYLERITQEQYQSTEQLEQRLRQDRELLEKLARDYQIQVEEIESWMKKELARLRDEGQLQIDNLTSWQIAERERLDALLKQNKQWSVEEFEQVLRQDRDHMQKTAFQYHTSVEEIEKWIQSEVNRLQQQGKLNIEKMTQWQKEQQQRILNLLQQQSSITVEEFQVKIQKDRTFLMNLARQYHVNVNEVEEYVQKVIQDLKEKGKFELEQLKGWQIAERDYILNLIKQHKNEWTTKEYEDKLKSDRDHLTQLADYYRVNVKEVEEWMIRELLRLRKETSEQIAKLSAWQVAELERLKQMIRENNRLNYVQFEVELKKQKDHLLQLSQQYSVSVTEIEQWLREQLLNLKTTGEVQVENLTKWQEDEQKRLIALCLQQQREITNEEFEQQLRRDRERLQKLANEYNVSVQQIEQWMKDELQRLKNSGLVQVEQLSYWQKIERERLQDWLKQQNKAATTEQLDAFIKRDKARLQRIAQDYHVTVEEIESWVEQEGARLQLLGMVKGPTDKISDWEFTESWTSKHPQNNWNSQGMFTNEEIWKEQTKAHLQAVAQVKPMSWQEFEQYLKNERMRWEQFARQYNVTVEEIETWLRQAAQELVPQGFIYGKVIVEEWETHEQNHLQQLINDKMRKQQQWSIEELERQLINDREYLQRLAQQYHLTVEQIIEWYKLELQKLLNQRKIVTENLTEWQKGEKDRLYNLISRNPYRTQEQWEQEILKDQTTLNRICDQYHVTIEEVEIWIRNEIKRLGVLGLIKGYDQHSGSGVQYSGWQEQERQRLRAIAAELSITEEEFLEFIAQDDYFQKQLTQMYGCSLEELVPFQKVVIANMNREGLLDRTVLLKVEPWQKTERDRLYSFIKDKSYNLENLQNWQKQEMLFNGLAANIGITAQELKDWQLQEFERIQKLAQYYQMNLNQLQDFREKELRFITYIMHKKTASEPVRVQWGANESRRYGVLQRKTGLQGEELVQWRRKLYLLSQARLPFSYGGYGGWENGPGTTNRTASNKPFISKDRGDQPPNVFDENIDNDEPGVMGSKYVLPSPPSAQMKMEPNQQSGGYGGSHSMSGSYSYSHGAGQNQMGSQALTADDYGQQQVQMEDEFGQQVQVEDLQGTFGGSASASSSSSSYTQGGYGGHGYGHNRGHGYGHGQGHGHAYGHSQGHGYGHGQGHAYGQQQQQVEVEDLTGTFTHQQPMQSEKQIDQTGQLEVQAEAEKPGLLSRWKNKIFG
ncbi:tiggrin [Lucilia sericata]|uniref:tiggrin n=1 Tax=Lucilia sericata TaxID=13632 RepID=UPI0018A8349C|nr:tiggrin [Lucilia sericata]